MTLIAAALKRCTSVDNEIWESDVAYKAEQNKRVEHCRALLWTAIRAQGYDPITMKPIAVLS